MSPSLYEIRLCSACGLRYPLFGDPSLRERCPNCLGETAVVLSRPLAGEDPAPADRDNSEAGVKFHIEALLDNIRSEWNVGAVFRTADALGVRKLYLCGITPTPASRSLAKTALGAESWIAWEYAPDAVLLAQHLIEEGAHLWALERGQRAQDISEATKLMQTALEHARPERARLVLVLGNEVTGVDPGLLDLSEHVLSIGMQGRKGSLNVAVAFGIAAYQLSFRSDD